MNHDNYLKIIEKHQISVGDELIIEATVTEFYGFTGDPYIKESPLANISSITGQ